jgi:lipid-A-disaccharide synthase
LVDYPGFNLRLAKKLRQKGFKVNIVHYIAHNIWEWKKNRLHEMEKSLDLLLLIFPFEKALFEKSSLKAPYVGNPSLEAINNYAFDPHWREKCGLSPHKPLISLFPGSRKEEVEKNLKIQEAAALELIKRYPEYEVAISGVNVSAQFTYELMRESHLSLAKCGTVVLELALFQVPTVVTYRVSNLNFFIAKLLFHLDRLRFYSLPNILRQKRIFPELIGYFFSKENCITHAEILLKEPYRTKCIEGCKEMREILKSPLPCSEQAAMEILPLLE